MKPDVHYVRNEGVALAYQLIGDGPADLFVAIGYLSNLEYAWEIPSNAAFLRRLAASRRLILMDRRGSGLSDRFSPSGAQRNLVWSAVPLAPPMRPSGFVDRGGSESGTGEHHVRDSAG